MVDRSLLTILATPTFNVTVSGSMEKSTVQHMIGVTAQETHTHTAHYIYIPYGAYTCISWVLNITNFEWFTKFISVKILTAMVRYMSSARVRKIISTKFKKKTAIHEKLDPRNISAIW